MHTETESWCDVVSQQALQVDHAELANHLCHNCHALCMQDTQHVFATSAQSTCMAGQENVTIRLLLTPQGHSSQAHAREAVCLYSIANRQQKQQAVAAIKGCQHAQGNVVHAISAFCFQLCISGLSTAIAVVGLL